MFGVLAVVGVLLVHDARPAAATDTGAERPVCPPGWEHIPWLDPIGEVCIQPDTETPMFPDVAWQTAGLSPPESPPASADPRTEPENPPANDRPTQQVTEEVPEPEPVPQPVPRREEERPPQPQEQVPEPEPEDPPLSADEQAALDELLRCQQNPAECQYAEESPDPDLLEEDLAPYHCQPAYDKSNRVWRRGEGCGTIPEPPEDKEQDAVGNGVIHGEGLGWCVRQLQRAGDTRATWALVSACQQGG